jgi:hypothetical protein
MKRNANFMILLVMFLLRAGQTSAQQKGTHASRPAGQQSVVLPEVPLGEVLNKQGQALGGFAVEWKQGRLTVDAENVLLFRVLDEVATQTGAGFSGLDHQRQISVHLSKVPLSAALQILLAHTDYAMMGNPSDPSTMRIVFFERLPTSTKRDVCTAARAMHNKEPEAMPSQESGLMGRMSPANEETVQAETTRRSGTDCPKPQIEADQLVEPVSDLSLFADALGRKDPAVKEAAIQALAQTEGPQAMDLLRQAFHDSDSALKTVIIESIGSRPDAVPLLLEASQDSEESVREASRVWLDSQANQP